jgi:hypothetical protein
MLLMFGVQVKITPVVNHVWEQRYYYGNLVAVHNNGNFVAFALKGKFSVVCFVGEGGVVWCT